MHALNLLPLSERMAVLLCCQNGLSHDEAARVLEIPLGTVKTNVLRGREKLKRALAVVVVTSVAVASKTTPKEK